MLLKDLPAGMAVLDWLWVFCAMGGHSKLVADFGFVDPGTRCCVTAKLLMFDPLGIAHVMCSPCGQQFHFEGTVEYGFTNYSLLDVTLTQNFPHVVLKQNDGFVLHFGQPSWFTLHSVIELCCGVGGLGNGSMAAGFPPVLAIDTNPRMTRMYSGHSAAATITGDINDTMAIVQAWKMQPHASVVASGFSCQPFSLLGDRRSSEDPRSVSVTATLDFAILMHSRMVVLECVPPALGDAFVQAEIQRFVQITGFNVSQTTLHLDHVWPSKRSRWWCVLSAKEFGPIQLDPFPVMDELPKVNHLIPTLGVWSRDDELTLRLDEKEVRAFGADTDQAVKYLLNMEGCAPTALHSWGNQLRGCHCGCRAFALSSDRLTSRGLFGLLVRFTHPDTGTLEHRHVHPNEAAALTGFDPMHVLDEDLRLGLAGIGQIASPLQSCWVFSHLGDLLHRFGFGVPALPPTFNLQALRSWLVHRCQQLWPPGSNLQDQKFCALVEFWNATPSLPMEELMDPKRWQPILGFFPSIGMVLDFIIRALGGDQESKDLIHDVLSMEMDVDSPVLEGFFALQPSEDLLRQLSGTADVEVDELDLVSEADLNLTRVHSDRPCTDPETVSTKVLLGSHPGPLMPSQSATCHDPGSVLHPTANCPSEPRSVPLHGAPDDCPSNPGRVPYFHTDCPSNPGSVPNPAALCRSVPLPCSIPAVCPSNPGSVLPTHADCPSNPGSVLMDCHDPFVAASDNGRSDALLPDTATEPSTSPAEELTMPSVHAPTALDPHPSGNSEYDLDTIPVPCLQVEMELSPQHSESAQDTPMMHLVDFEPWFPHQKHLDVPDELQNTHSQMIQVADTALPTVFRTSPHTTIADLIKADMLNTGNPAPVWVSNRRGEELPLDTTLQPSMTVLFWSKGECWLLPRMPWQFCLDAVATDSDSDLVSVIEGECGLLPRMPDETAPDVLGEVSGDENNQDFTAADTVNHGECGPLPRMPDEKEMTPDVLGVASTVMSSPFVEFKTPCPTVTPTAAWTCPAILTQNLQPLGPLMQLDRDSLVTLKPPTTMSLHQLQAVISQETDVQERRSLLQLQGSLMADDELRHHLNAIISERNRMVNANFPQVAVPIDPLLFSNWIGSNFCSGLEWWTNVKHWIPEHFVLVTITRLGHHWLPLQFFCFRKTLHIFTWDSPEIDHTPLIQVFERLCTVLGCNHYVVDRTDRLFECSDHCGALALSYIQYVLLRTEVAQDRTQVIQYHQHLRASFEQHLDTQQRACKPWIWGDGTDALVTRLAELLKEHGVPKDHALSRAQSAIKVLGEKDVSTALQHSVPWKQLKQLGNNVKFQFVLPSELQSMIEANKGRAVGPKKTQKPKPKRPAQSEEISLDPSKLHILDGTFRCQGHVLPQIGLHQIGPVAMGVILADAKDAAPYLRGNQAVSTEPLALLILGDLTEPMQLPQTPVSVPCACAINREPVLLDAIMVQLGQQPVVKHEVPNAIILDQIDVSTIKFTIFRDEVETAWEDIQNSPVRYLVSQFPLLKLCLQEGCKCGSWRNPTKLPTHEVIQDVWRRQFLTKTYKPSKPRDAYCYSVCLRVPTEIQVALLAQSGHAGTYLEPRTHDAKGADDAFVVVWAPKLSHSELNVMKQTRPAIIGLAWVQERKGLRVRADQAQSIHELVRPGTMFLPQGQKSQWLCGPFPYGCDRIAISKALDQIKWRARPLRPMMPCPGKGTMWLMVSVEPPPAPIIQMAHGEIVFSKHKAATPEAAMTKATPVATAETLALCEPKIAKRATTGVDLLQIHDPWKQLPPGLPAPSVPPSAQQSFRDMEERIETAILAKINAAPSNMESDDVTDRLTQLEQQSLPSNMPTRWVPCSSKSHSNHNSSTAT